MAILVFCALLFLGVSFTNILVIQPFHLSAVLHLPQLVVWGLVLIVFAWLFGDDSKSF